jgi:hypothetical protein
LLAENNTQNDARVWPLDWFGSSKETKGICLAEVFATLSIEFLTRKWRILHTTVSNAHQIGKKKKYVSEIRHIIIEMYPVIINNVCTAVLLP